MALRVPLLRTPNHALYHVFHVLFELPALPRREGLTRARCEGARLLHASMYARVPRAHEAITAYLALGH